MMAKARLVVLIGHGHFPSEWLDYLETLATRIKQISSLIPSKHKAEVTVICDFTAVSGYRLTGSYWAYLVNKDPYPVRDALLRYLNIICEPRKTDA